MNILYQPTCAGRNLCSRDLEFDQCRKALTIKKHTHTACCRDFLICAGACELGNASYLCFIRGG